MVDGNSQKCVVFLKFVKSKVRGKTIKHTTGACIRRHGGLVLHGDTLAARQLLDSC